MRVIAKNYLCFYCSKKFRTLKLFDVIKIVLTVLYLKYVFYTVSSDVSKLYRVKKPQKTNESSDSVQFVENRKKELLRDGMPWGWYVNVSILSTIGHERSRG